MDSLDVRFAKLTQTLVICYEHHDTGVLGKDGSPD